MVPPEEPERRARVLIDRLLDDAGWAVQDRAELNLAARRGIAVREFPMATGYGEADYLLFVDQAAVGVVEAKPAGHTLSGVQVQARAYSEGLPEELHAPVRPLPFIYASTGSETLFLNGLDPAPRSHRVYSFHRPETLADWIAQPTLTEWTADRLTHDDLQARRLIGDRPSTLRSRLRTLPALNTTGLRPNQIEGIRRLEQSLYDAHPRALVQMVTGSGKTYFAITAVYRMIKFGGARRVVFLVDRANLAEQAEKEFQGYLCADSNRKFTELYVVQRLTSNKIAESAKVVITTIQRLYSMLRGEELDPRLEERSRIAGEAEAPTEPVHVGYNAAIPPEFFDVMIIDECHRSIYSDWREVVEYFDAFLIGLTATPAKHTFGFFRKNLVMEYGHEQAVADGVNVDFDVYQIRTRITREGSSISADVGRTIGHRDKETRAVRWQKPDEDITYGASDLDRAVVAPDQIRTLIRTFRDKLPTEIFPGRTEVPKTLIFAKDDSHAEDIVEIVREEFKEGDDFAQKITYKTTGADPRQLIQDFRTSYYPRIAVTVDMIATGTDIKPIEIVMFMRTVKSRTLFEQMKGRGVRTIDPTDFQQVTRGAKTKDHFVIVDCVGVCESELSDSRPLDRQKGTPFKKLLDHVAAGGIHEEYLSSLASRLARLEQQCSPEQHEQIERVSGGISLADLTKSIFKALAPERQEEFARAEFAVPDEKEPTREQLRRATERLCRTAVEPLLTKPQLREALREIKRQTEQLIDDVSMDEVLVAGTSDEAKEKAKALVASFEQFIADHRDEIDALQLLYSHPAGRRLRYKDVKELVAAIKAPPRSWTPERLWRAYELVAAGKVRGGSGERLLTDVVSLVRFAIHQDDELVPFREQVVERFARWMGQQENGGRRFTPEQQRWLEMMRDHVATRESLHKSRDVLEGRRATMRGRVGDE